MSSPDSTGNEPRPVTIGDTLGQYRLVELIAVGGMGVVYRAYEESLERFVALKVLSPELARDPDVARQFLDEARAVATLNHPNVVHVYSAGRQNDTYYFAMELVEGTHFESLILNRHQLAPNEAVGFIRQAAVGLQHAHQHGLLHGDVKPANFIVTTAGAVKVTDFGLARRMKAGTGHTADASGFGTPGYVSPEIINGETSDQRSDIYSLGATLYHLLAGRPPFVGATTEETLRHHLDSPVLPLNQFNPRVSPALQLIVSKMLAKNAAARYQTYGDLLQSLDRYLTDRHFGAQGSAPVKPVAPLPPKKQESFFSVVFTLIAVAACILIIILIARLQTAGKHVGPAPGPTTNQINTGEEPPPPSVNREALAARELAPLKIESDEAARFGQLGRAFAVFDQWPAARFAGTAAQEEVTATRAHLRESAETMWGEASAQVDTALAAQKFEDALALCDRLQTVCAGIPELTSEIQSVRNRVTTAAREQAAQQTLATAAAEKERAAKLQLWNGQADALITGLQWEKGQQDLQRAINDAGTDEELKHGLAELLTEFDALVILRKAVADRLPTKPTATLTLATKGGDLQAQVTGYDNARLTLRQDFGRGGFGETSVTWGELTPASVCRVFAAALDPANADELFGYSVFIVHQALAKQARIDDARRTLQALVQRVPARAASVERYLALLAEFEARQQQGAATRQMETEAAQIWTQLQSAIVLNQWDRVATAAKLLTTDYAGTEFAKTKTKDLDQIARFIAERNEPRGFVPLDLTSAFNANFILHAGEKADRAFQGQADYATIDFLEGGPGGTGLPNDGQLPIPDSEPPGKFQLQVGDGNDAIAIAGTDGGYSGETTVTLPAAQQRKYAKIYFLFASNTGRGNIRVTMNYEGGTTDPHRLKAYAWNTEPETRNLTVAFTGTRSTGEKEDVHLFTESMTADTTRRLQSVTLTWISTSGSSREHCVGIFALSALPAEPGR